MLDPKRMEQRLHGVPAKPCVLTGGKARILLMIVEQPKYFQPPEWSLLGLLSVALDPSPLKLTSAVQHSMLPYEGTAVCAQVMLEAKRVPVTPAALHRVPLNVVCVLDASASMLEHQVSVQNAISHMFERLVPQDHLGIVASAGDGAGVLLEMSLMDDDGRWQAAEALKSVHLGGESDITRGLALAIQCMEMMESRDPCAVSAIFLLASSQDANLQAHMDFFLDRCAAIPCSLYTFALPSEQDMDVLSELSARSRTPFTFTDPGSMLQDRLSRLVDLLSNIVAQQVEVTLKGPFELEDILTPFDFYRSPCDSSAPPSWHVLIPDLAVGERRDILVKLTVPDNVPRRSDGNISLLEVSVSSHGHVLSEPTLVSMRHSDMDVAVENYQVQESLERLEAGLLLRNLN